MNPKSLYKKTKLQKEPPSLKEVHWDRSQYTLKNGEILPAQSRVSLSWDFSLQLKEGENKAWNINAPNLGSGSDFGKILIEDPQPFVCENSFKFQILLTNPLTARQKVLFA